MRARLYDAVALLARCGVGAVFMAHGWQKIQVGVTATGQNFEAMDVPLPTVAAVYSTFVELLCGAALIIGIGLPFAGALLFIDMAGALAFVNGRHGIFLIDGQGRVRNGSELVLVLALATAVFAVGGAGRITVDRRLFAKRTTESGGPAPGSRSPASAPAPGPGDTRPVRPRPLAEVAGTSRDVLVAGRKETAPKESGSAGEADPDTVRTRKPRPKSGS